MFSLGDQILFKAISGFSTLIRCEHVVFVVLFQQLESGNIGSVNL